MRGLLLTAALLLSSAAFAGEHSLVGGKTPVELQAPKPPSAVLGEGEREAKINAEVGKNVIEGSSPVNQVKVLPKKSLNYNLVWGQFLRSTNVPSSISVTYFESKEKREEGKKTSLCVSEEKNTRKEEKEVKESKSVRLTGYCYFDRDLKITTLTLPVEIPCQFDDGSVGLLSGVLLPDFKTYSLILKPRTVLINGQEYKVTSGYVMNKSRSSLNVADEVNKRYLRKVLYAGISSGITQGLDAYQKYVEGKYTNTTVVGRDSPVVVESHDYPSNYPFVAGVLGFLKGITKTFTEVVKQETNSVPVLYKINAGKTVYVNLHVERGQR